MFLFNVSFNLWFILFMELSIKYKNVWLIYSSILFVYLDL